jgi:hypothetical protein
MKLKTRQSAIVRNPKAPLQTPELAQIFAQALESFCKLRSSIVFLLFFQFMGLGQELRREEQTAHTEKERKGSVAQEAHCAHRTMRILRRPAFHCVCVLLSDHV